MKVVWCAERILSICFIAWPDAPAKNPIYHGKSENYPERKPESTDRSDTITTNQSHSEVKSALQVFSFVPLIVRLQIMEFDEKRIMIIIATTFFKGIKEFAVCPLNNRPFSPSRIWHLHSPTSSIECTIRMSKTN